MAGLQKNCTLIIVVFILLCFITLQARARTLKERNNMGSGTTTTDANTGRDDVINHHGDDKFKPKEDEGNGGNSGEVFAMDYTPASRKPPIHN
ncbi:hypothetical protein PIB30_014583 [Stylosanthes scabra]|uniref:Uncharacterized protein n=1 Tax=Stylosanthes scabra TaxID=79078 RepID=A0ABU6Q6L4_9FABA|nr:hypothetical protein [Stylosanthes scabra]